MITWEDIEYDDYCHPFPLPVINSKGMGFMRSIRKNGKIVHNFRDEMLELYNRVLTQNFRTYVFVCDKDDFPRDVIVNDVLPVGTSFGDWRLTAETIKNGLPTNTPFYWERAKLKCKKS